ncbi:MAG TPA: hypothetical protein VMX96_06045 [Dehalococcoidia bacterium]|nr:hypothetical protein [Dehalococcoidia bacterium]
MRALITIGSGPARADSHDLCRPEADRCPAPQFGIATDVYIPKNGEEMYR